MSPMWRKWCIDIKYPSHLQTVKNKKKWIPGNNQKREIEPIAMLNVLASDLAHVCLGAPNRICTTVTVHDSGKKKCTPKRRDWSFRRWSLYGFEDRTYNHAITTMQDHLGRLSKSEWLSQFHFSQIQYTKLTTFMTNRTPWRQHPAQCPDQDTQPHQDRRTSPPQQCSPDQPCSCFKNSAQQYSIPPSDCHPLQCLIPPPKKLTTPCPKLLRPFQSSPPLPPGRSPPYCTT